MTQAADAQRSMFNPFAHLGIPGSLAGGGPALLSSQQPVTGAGAEAQHFTGGYCWDGLERKSGVCVYGQREPEANVGPGSSYVYCGGECFVVHVCISLHYPQANNIT